MLSDDLTHELLTWVKGHFFGKYRGTVIMQEEQDAGLAFMKSLTQEEKDKILWKNLETLLKL